ncbi:unnamed protein product [Ilex paraguariensis]|uniref:ARC105/Med15 mediator subunit C-terminal domain-containing protein n=1 Tax=Ilex paraguariensis TaxID=185542 RepID=A0ABC8RLR3_9AQUA
MTVVTQQLQQQSQISQQHPFKQQVQNQLLKKDFNQGVISCANVQTENQRTTFSTPQMQSPRQTVMKTPSVMHLSLGQSVPLPGLPQNQQYSVRQSKQPLLEQDPQSLRKQQQPQQAPVNNQEVPLLRQLMLPPEQQQQFMGQLPDSTDIQLDQSKGKQKCAFDMQHQKLLVHNDHSTPHPQQLGQQSNTSRSNGAQSVTLDSICEARQENDDDLQEEVYQKVTAMRDIYFPKLREAHKKFLHLARSSQVNSLPEQEKTAHLERFKKIANAFKYYGTFLHLPKNKLSTDHKRMVDVIEKKIIDFLKFAGPEKSSSSLRQHVPQPLVQLSQMSMLPQSQNPQGDPCGNQINPHFQLNNSCSKIEMQKNNVTSLQQSAILSDTTTSPQTIMNLQQPCRNLDGEQGIGFSSFIKYSASDPQPNTVLSQSLQNINPFESHTMLQSMHLKSQNDQQPIKAQDAKKQLQQCNQTHVHQMNEIDNQKVIQSMDVKGQVLLQYPLAGHHSMNNHHQVKSESPSPLSSPQLLQAEASLQIPQHSSTYVDQKNLQRSLEKAGTPFPSLDLSAPVPSPSSSLSPSSIKWNSEKLTSSICSLSNYASIGLQQTTDGAASATPLLIPTPGSSASPLLALCNDLDGNHNSILPTDGCDSSVSKQPFQRLLKAVRSMSHEALSASVGGMESVVSIVERTAGSTPGDGSRMAVGEDLVAMTNCHLQGRNYTMPVGIAGRKRARCYTIEVPSNTVSSVSSINDSVKLLTSYEASDLESTATSYSKRPRTEVNYSLLEEIKEINRKLIETVVDINAEDVNSMVATSVTEGSEGTIVKCSYSPVAVSPKLNSQDASLKLVPIKPLQLLVPTNYPSCSPIFLEKLSAETSTGDDDLSAKAKSKLDVSLRTLRQPMSLGEIAKTWDACARTVFSEYAQQHGGGNFSSRYGTWKNCLTDA